MSVFKNAAISGGIEGIVVGMMQSFGQAVQKNGPEFVKSRFLGVGTNDEYLFQSAVAYAFSELEVNIKDINRICRLINSYDKSQRKRIVEIIGKNEDDVKTKIPSLDKEGNVMTDKKKGSTIFSESSFKANIKGAKIIAMLAKMTDAEIKEFFIASGALETVVVKAKTAGKKLATKLTEAAEKSRIDEDTKSFLGKKTWLEKWADNKI